MKKGNGFSRSVKLLALGLSFCFLSFSMQGCAAGNWGLVRTVAKFNLKLSIIPRILIYLIFLIIPVYAVSFLVDFLILNVIEFWTGKPPIKAQHKTYEKDGKTYEIVNRLDPLRHTTITITDENGKKSVTELVETKRQTIEIVVDGVKKKEIKNFASGDIAEVISYNETSVETEKFDISQAEMFERGDIRTNFLFAKTLFQTNKNLVCQSN